VQLLFLQTHRETDRVFATSGVQFPYSNCGLLHYRCTTFSSQVKSNIVNILVKAATLGIILHIDGVPGTKTEQ
jgi:hypothetical protein